MRGLRIIPLGLEAREILHSKVNNIRGFLHQVVDSEVEESLLELCWDVVVVLLAHLPRLVCVAPVSPPEVQPSIKLVARWEIYKTEIQVNTSPSYLTRIAI